MFKITIGYLEEQREHLLNRDRLISTVPEKHVKEIEELRRQVNEINLAIEVLKAWRHI